MVPDTYRSKQSWSITLFLASIRVLSGGNVAHRFVIHLGRRDASGRWSDRRGTASGEDSTDRGSESQFRYDSG